MSFLREHIIIIPLIAFIIVVTFKSLYLWKQGTFSIPRALGTGGMPSGHSAIVTSLATAIGVKYGVASDLFALCLIFGSIVIYDALNLRFEAGLHAKAINSLGSEDQKLNESIGHLPEEVFVGSVIGIVTSLVLL